MKRKTTISLIFACSLVFYVAGLLRAQISMSGHATVSGTVGMLLQGSGSSCVTGVGLAGSCTSADPVRVDNTAVPGWLHTSASPTWTSIAAGGQQEQTISLAGAATGDLVMAGPSPAIEQGLTWDAYVSSNGVVSVRYQNNTSGAIVPATLPITVVLLKSL